MKARRQSTSLGIRPASISVAPSEVMIGGAEGEGRWNSSCASSGIGHQQAEHDRGHEQQRGEDRQLEGEHDVGVCGFLVEQAVPPYEIRIRSIPIAANSSAR